MKSQADAVYVPSQTADLPRGSVVAIEVVEDPHSRDGEKIQVLRSVRDDPLAGMLARQQIDIAQFTAGRKWQFFHERSAIGSVVGIDPTKERVDGGSLREPISERQKEASDELKAARAELGIIGAQLVSDILADRLTMPQAAVRRGWNTARGIIYTGQRFRGCLETLAILWKLAPPRRSFPCR